MENGYLSSPLVFLIQVAFGLFLLAVLLRFLLQLFRADFYNPLSQLIVKVTSPVLRPLRRIIPAIGKIDTASLVLLWLLQALELALIALILGIPANPLGSLLWAIPELVALCINLFFIVLLIQVIMSWITPGGAYHPASGLLYTLTEPLLRPVRRILPPFSGLDFSPMVAMVGLVLLRMLLLPPLLIVTHSPFR
jgi:YggT family protein